MRNYRWVWGIALGAVLVGSVVLWTSQGVLQSEQQQEQDLCIDCHKEITPQLVKDFQQSKKYALGIRCEACHGSEHTSAEDVAKAQIPTPETCGGCHPDRVEQFKAGKHAFAWAAMNAMPTTHMQPMELMEGKKGCGGCHKIGLKTEDEIKAMRAARRRFTAWRRATPATRDILSPWKKRASPKPAPRATWALIIPIGRCGAPPSTG
jgi:hypothetical protein